MRDLFWMFLGFCLVALLLHVLARPVESQFIAEVAPRLVHRAHLYHGIDYSTLDHSTGDRYFERDGRRCPLFTDAFWKREAGQ
jgi:hypothetical protein